MADEKWPNRRARYDADQTGAQATSRWQEGINDALDENRLVLKPPSNGLLWARDLTGRCPRCDHEIEPRRLLYKYVQVTAAAPKRRAKLLDGEFIAAGGGLLRLRRDNFDAEFNIVCTCDRAHGTRPPDDKGCGAGKRLWIKLPWQWGSDGR